MSRARLFIISIIICILVTCSCCATVYAESAGNMGSEFSYRLMSDTDEVEIIEYKGSGGYVAIPDNLGGQVVTSIGDRTFLGMHGITIVFIPDTVKNIGLKAFEDNSSLSEVTLPYGLETIGNKAFASCVSLSSVVIPDGTKRIGESCFEGCRKLNSVFIPESVTEIGNMCFADCDNVTVYCYNGSYAQDYCDIKKVNYKDISKASYNPYEYSASDIRGSSAPYIQSQGVSWIIYLIGGLVIIACAVFVVMTYFTTKRSKNILSDVGKVKNKKP